MESPSCFKRGSETFARPDYMLFVWQSQNVLGGLSEAPLWIRIGSCNLSINSGLQAKDCDDFKNLAWNPFSSPPKRIFGETSHFIFSQFSFNIMQISECIHACTNAQYALFQFAVKIIAYTFYLLITIEAYYTILPLIQE